MPPLSGFIAKFAIIDGLLGLEDEIDATTWTLVALIIASGLAIIIATTRAGIDLIWTPSDKPQPGLRLAEGVPGGFLPPIFPGLLIFAGPTMRPRATTGRSLDDKSTRRCEGQERG